MAVVVRGWKRLTGAMAVIPLWMAAYPPCTLPTYWIALAPLMWIWRGSVSGVSIPRASLEALSIGFAIAWMSTGFVRDAIPVRAELAQAIGCVLFGCQFIPLAICARLLAGWSIYLGAICCSAIAVAAEVIQARLGVAWSVLSLCLPAAPSPVAQWAHYITPFGVSGILYVANFICMPDLERAGWRRLVPVFGWLSVVGLATEGGLLIAARVEPRPLTFSAMLIQPHVRAGERSGQKCAQALDRLTRAALQTRVPVDLIVWPETALAPSVETAEQPGSSTTGGPVDLPSFRRSVREVYRTAALAGVTLLKQKTEIKYGLEVPCTLQRNCACLITPSGAQFVQEKLALFPFREGLPSWLDEPWIRNSLNRLFGFDPTYSAGSELRPLCFVRRDGLAATVVVAICYESYLPWLPQFRHDRPADAVIHLTYDGDFARHEGYATRQIWACQFRAIETRKWNLLCTWWSGSAIIDPRGRVIRRLGSVEGVLRTDSIGEAD
jgi:apolipoprotein N-acyltransferase